MLRWPGVGANRPADPCVAKVPTAVALGALESLYVNFCPNPWDGGWRETEIHTFSKILPLPTQVEGKTSEHPDIALPDPWVRYTQIVCSEFYLLEVASAALSNPNNPVVL